MVPFPGAVEEGRFSLCVIKLVIEEHSTTLVHLSDVLSGTNVRLLIVGGAGSLYVGANIHKAMDKRLLQVQDTMEAEMKRISVSDVAADIHKAVE